MLATYTGKFRSYTDRLEPYAPLLLRLIVGITFLVMGLPKLENIGGFNNFLVTLGVPLAGFFAVFIALLETVGGMLYIVGLGVRYVGVLSVIEMLVTTLRVKSAVGFVAPAGRPGVGAELDLLLLVGALVLVILGPGELSVEKNILKREL